MNIEECKFYDKETGCIECKQVVVQNLAELVSWQREKLEKIEELCKKQDILRGRQALATAILKIVRGEE